MGVTKGKKIGSRRGKEDGRRRGKEEGRRGCGSAVGGAGGRPAVPAGGFDLSLEGVLRIEFSAPIFLLEPSLASVF